jgi:hypothetical protein
MADLLALEVPGGATTDSPELRGLIRRMAAENLWVAISEYEGIGVCRVVLRALAVMVRCARARTPVMFGNSAARYAATRP